jgi:hypothetical protein
LEIYDKFAAGFWEVKNFFSGLFGARESPGGEKIFLRFHGYPWGKF